MRKKHPSMFVQGVVVTVKHHKLMVLPSAANDAGMRGDHTVTTVHSQPLRIMTSVWRQVSAPNPS